MVTSELLVSKRSQVGWRESFLKSFLKLVWFGVELRSLEYPTSCRQPCSLGSGYLEVRYLTFRHC